MVIPALINRVESEENPMDVWGDGTETRDFMHASDVAKAMMLVMEKNPQEPINIGTGSQVTIKHLLDVIQKIAKKYVDVKWTPMDRHGDKTRPLDVSKLFELGFKPEVYLYEGLSETYKWYEENKENVHDRFNAFTS